MSTRSLFIVLLVVFPWFCACTKDVGPPKPPVSLPFAVQQAGSRIETELQVTEHRSYLFDLQLMYKEGDEEDRKRVRKLAGGAGVDKNGKVIEPGVPIAVRFKINAIDVSGERPMLDKEISELTLAGWGANFFNKRIAAVTLKPGHYRISIESLKNVPELLSTPVIFSIAWHAKTSPIPN